MSDDQGAAMCLRGRAAEPTQVEVRIGSESLTVRARRRVRRQVLLCLLAAVVAQVRVCACTKRNTIRFVCTFASLYLEWSSAY